jgi:hypothetical protein
MRNRSSFFFQIRRSHERAWGSEGKALEDSAGQCRKAVKRLGIAETQTSLQSSLAPTPEELTRVERQNRSNIKRPFYGFRSVSDETKFNVGNERKHLSQSHRPSLFRNRSQTSSMSIELPVPNLSFLPSEAQKIVTPPASAQPMIDPFSCFPSHSSSPRERRNTRLPNPHLFDNPYHNDDVFRLKMNINDVKDVTVYGDIPEHLPTSPLCPGNPKHKSGGKGICPYHGKSMNQL